MRLDSAAFNRFIGSIGQTVTWRRRRACPCFDANSGAASHRCPACHGKGHIWAKPVGATLGIASQKVQKEWAAFGKWESGDAVVIVGSDSPLYAAGDFDRVLMLNATDRFSRSLVRDGADRLHMTIDRIDEVFWFDEAGQVVEGAVPAVQDDGSLFWATRGPPEGVSYSISGTRFNEYFVYNDMPRNRNMHHGAALPKSIVLRKFDLLGR